MVRPNAIARPTSSGSPVRFMGTALAICVRISVVEVPVLLALFETICSNRAVFVAPGSTLLTVIPCTPTSLAHFGPIGHRTPDCVTDSQVVQRLFDAGADDIDDASVSSCFHSRQYRLGSR